MFCATILLITALLFKLDLFCFSSTISLSEIRFTKSYGASDGAAKAIELAIIPASDKLNVAVFIVIALAVTASLATAFMKVMFIHS